MEYDWTQSASLPSPALALLSISYNYHTNNDLSITYSITNPITTVPVSRATTVWRASVPPAPWTATTAAPVGPRSTLLPRPDAPTRTTRTVDLGTLWSTSVASVTPATAAPPASCRSAPPEPILWMATATRLDVTAPAEVYATTVTEPAHASVGSTGRSASTRPLSSKRSLFIFSKWIDKWVGR